MSATSRWPRVSCTWWQSSTAPPVGCPRGGCRTRPRPTSARPRSRRPSPATAHPQFSTQTGVASSPPSPHRRAQARRHPLRRTGARAVKWKSLGTNPPRAPLPPSAPALVPFLIKSGKVETNSRPPALAYFDPVTVQTTGETAQLP